ncbi:MAG: hypothetical protein ACE5KA_04700 [Nitrososphaerales archaeon]
MADLPTAWGALPYCQMHFVVLGDGKRFAEVFVARTRKKTSGVMNKKIIDVWWEGGIVAEQLNHDADLKLLLKEVLLDEDAIYIDPTENCIRIHNGWKAEGTVEISSNTVQAYNTIAGHVKKFLSELTISKT